MCVKSCLELYFGNQSSPGLYRTVFHVPGTTAPVIGVRGTTIPTIGLPFIWGPASQSLSLLFVSAAAKSLTAKAILFPLLEGPSTSPAGVIARLLKKRTSSWLHDLFGSDASGRSLLHRMVVLGNPRGKQQGPMTATLRSEYLDPSNIKVFIDGADISNDQKALETLRKSLTDSFIPRKDPLAKRRGAKKPQVVSTRYKRDAEERI